MAISKLLTQLHTPNNTLTPSVKTSARLFVDSMSDDERKRFKNMIESGIESGRNVATLYGVPYKEFIAEVRKII